MSNATEYDFGSVGETEPALREREKLTFDRPKSNINIRTPLSLGYGQNALFVMNTDMGSAVADNLKNLLITNSGERVMNPRFGANLKPLLTEFSTPLFENEVMTRIKSAVKNSMPYVSLATMKLEKIETPASSGLVAIQITIKYSVASTSLSGQEVSVTLYTMA
jgi:phage baseplate assembly protein W